MHHETTILKKEMWWIPGTGGVRLPWGGRHPSRPREMCRGFPGRVQRCVPAATSVQCVGGNSPGQRWFQTEGDKTSQARTSQSLPEKSGEWVWVTVSSTWLSWPLRLHLHGHLISLLSPPLHLGIPCGIHEFLYDPEQSVYACTS